MKNVRRQRFPEIMIYAKPLTEEEAEAKAELIEKIEDLGALELWKVHFLEDAPGDYFNRLIKKMRVPTLIIACANCHFVKTDEDWEDVGLDPQSGNVSHSICPKCVRKLYPDIADKVLAKKGD